MEKLIEENFDSITTGTSLRYREDDYIVYEFKWINKRDKFDTSSFNKSHEFKKGDRLVKMTRTSVDLLAKELVEDMRKNKYGKYFEPDYKDYFITLLVYFLTWEAIAALCWYFWLKNYAILLFSLPGVFVLLAMISIIDEIKQNRMSSYCIPTYRLNKFQDSFENGTRAILESNFRYLKIKVKVPDESMNFAEVKPIVPYAPAIVRNRGPPGNKKSVVSAKLQGDTEPINAKAGGMNYPEVGMNFEDI